MTIAINEDIKAEDLLNRKTYSNDSHVKASNDKKIYVHITRQEDLQYLKVFLYLYGETANMPVSSHFHNVGSFGSDAIGNCTGTGGGNACGHNHTISGSTASNIDLLNGTDVPRNVEIWIDGTEYTATIGDPNAKGGTMYNAGTDDWGVNSTTEWNTGKLDLSNLIDWTVGEHYIEFKCGAVGGRLLYSLYINNET